MPTYQPARRGVQFSEAYAEAAGSALLGRAMLAAYELWHPNLAEPIRFVNDKAALFATLEADAPRNAGGEVEFLACPLEMQRPEESDTAATPTVSLARPDLGGILKAALDSVRGSLDSWVLIERIYASDDTTAPAKLPPLSYELKQAEVAGSAAKIGASYDDDGNVAVPRITFRREEYPGLAR